MATLNGGEGNDTITGTNSADTINGRGGDDVIDGRGGDDIIFGGDGRNSIFSGDGDDVVVEGHYFSTNLGTPLPIITGYSEDYNIYAGSGDDFVIVSNVSSSSKIDGGDGFDILSFNGTTFLQYQKISGFEVWNLAGLWANYFDPRSNNFATVWDGRTGYFYNSYTVVYLDNYNVSGLNTKLQILINPYGDSSVDASKVDTGYGIIFYNEGSGSVAIHSGSQVDDEFYGGANSDSFKGNGGDDQIDGGDGVDTAIYSGSYTNYTITEITYNTFSVKDNVGTDGTDTIIDVNKLQFSDQTVDVVIRGMQIIGDETDEALSGGSSADHVDGAGGDDTLSGLGGHDSIDGGDGSDTLIGNVGNDFLNGDADDDSISGGTGNDSVDGGIGNDTLYSSDGDDTVLGGDGSDLIVGGDGAGDDNYQGGTGIDTIKYTSALSGIDVNLSSGLSKSIGVNDVAGIGSDRLSSIENVIAGRYADKIVGNAASNTLNGGGGSDTMSGGLGNDTYVTDGGDRITESSNQGIDTVQSTVSYTLGYNIEKLVLTGSSALNGTGNSLGNTLTGNAASNTLNGGGGNDTLIGGAGADMLIGGLGKDVMTGGSGSDVFIFSNTDQSSSSSSTCDVITDFVHGVDKFNLRAIDAFSNTTSTNDNFRWNTGTSFNNTTQGEVRFKQFNNDGTANDFTMVYIDTDSDVGPEMMIRLTGLRNLTADDFIL